MNNSRKLVKPDSLNINQFLQVEVERKEDKVQIVFNHISVDGKKLSEKRFEG